MHINVTLSAENKVKELVQQRELLVANLEENLQDLQSAKILEASIAEKDKHGECRRNNIIGIGPQTEFYIRKFMLAI